MDDADEFMATRRSMEAMDISQQEQVASDSLLVDLDLRR